MESLVWFPIDYILREINRENQLVTLDDILIFGVQGFLKIQIIIDTNGDLFTYSLVEKRYLCSDVEYGKCWSIFPTAEQDMLQKLRKNQSVMIDSILVSGDWGDPKTQCIEFKEPREVSRENLVLWHEEYKKLRSLLFPSPELIAEIEKANAPEPVPEKPFQESERRWPWGNRETELLRKLALAAERFWKLYDPNDPTTAPTSKQVTEWLKQQGVADRTAEKMAQILRADGLPSGRRK